MGLMSWIRKAYEKVAPVLGKVKAGVEGAVKMYDKGKEAYKNVKNTVSNLPVVGAVASRAIERGENALNDAIKAKTGVDARATLGKVDNAVGTARKVASYLPSG